MEMRDLVHNSIEVRKLAMEKGAGTPPWCCSLFQVGASSLICPTMWRPAQAFFYLDAADALLRKALNEG